MLPLSPRVNLSVAKRRDERREVDEVVPRQAALGQERPFEVPEHPNAEVVEHPAVRVGVPAEFTGTGADVGPGKLEGRKKAREGRRRGDGHGDGRQAELQPVHPNATPALPAHHEQAVAVKRAETALAQVRGEDVQRGLLRQLEKAGLAVQVFFVVILEQPGPCQFPVRQPQGPACPAHRDQ